MNDAELTRRVSAALTRELGAERTKETPPEMASEDFSEFQRAGVPVLMLRVGAVEPAKFEAAQKSGTPLPSLHSSLFAPDREPTLDGAGRCPVAGWLRKRFAVAALLGLVRAALAD